MKRYTQLLADWPQPPRWPWWNRLLLVLAAVSWLAAPSMAQTRSTNWSKDVQPLLQKYCYDCHSEGNAEGKLALDQFSSVEDAAKQPELWWKVLKNLRAKVMPPAGEARPTADETELIASWIKFESFGINADDPDPGRLTVRRLNRAEYGNTLNDLMGTRFEAKLLFPADDSGSGFDNVGDALTFSPMLMEKYLKAARMVVADAVPTQCKIVPLQVFNSHDFTSEDGATADRGLNGKQAQRVVRSFQVDEAGPFNVDVEIKLRGSFDFDPARYVVEFSIDGEQRFKNEYGWDGSRLIRFRYDEQLAVGQHQLAFDLSPIALAEDEEDDQPSEATDVRFEIAAVRVEGPVGAANLVHPPNYERFFTRDEPPEAVEERRAYAAEVLTQFSNRAFRSQVSADTVARLVNIAETAYAQTDQTFEMGIAEAMVAVLCSPRFLFHLEASGTNSQAAYGLVDEVALASRLSYFLWSTMPDEELMQLVGSNQLRANLGPQIQRMMSDKRSQEFLGNFVGQWLRTRDVTQVSVDPLVILGLDREYEELRQAFRSRGRFRRSSDDMSAEERKQYERYRELRAVSDRFDAELKRAMQLETEETVEHVLRQDLSLLDLIDSDYTFLNERLAQHYNIAGVQGSNMRRVELPADSPRGGLLTQASMLLVTSNPTRTSPVKRGLFILDNILGTPAPPAPPGVPDLEDSTARFGDREPTLRELLAAHRESALCSSCHARMDPLGLALENFDALGMWRDTEKGQPIEAAGELITGERFANVSELKKVLRDQHASDFYRCLTQKLMTYAIGRGLEYSDEHAIDLIVKDLEENGGRFSVLLQGVVASAPFQKQRF